MSDKGVRRVVGELIADQPFRSKFFDDPEGTMRVSGFDLSDLEIDSLKNLTKKDLYLEVGSTASGLRVIELEQVTVW